MRNPFDQREDTEILVKLIEDIRSIYRNDPAAVGIEFLLYPSFHAMLFHRLICHPMYGLGIPFLPRLFSQISRLLTGMEIHPGARIGPGFFCDHGMAVVIGETVEIGPNCVMFHGVTLGGTGKHSGKRHPTVGANVFIGTHATILGPVNIGDNAKIGAESVIINHDVPANCTAVGAPARLVRKNGEHVDLPLPPSAYHREDKRIRQEATGNNSR